MQAQYRTRSQKTLEHHIPVSVFLVSYVLAFGIVGTFACTVRLAEKRRIYSVLGSPLFPSAKAK